MGLAGAAVTAVVVAAVVAVAVLATTAAAMMMLGLELLGRGVTHKLDKSSIAYSLASQLVVEVHGDFVVGDLSDDALDTHAVLGHHGDDGTHADVLVIKLAINVEHLFLELIDHVGVLGAEGLLGLQGKVKFLALFQIDDVILETLNQRDIKPKHKGIRMFLIELEDTHLLVTIDHKNLVNELNIFTCLNFLH